MSLYLGPGIRVATVDFAKKAHAYFCEHHESHTFTEGDIEVGALFAVRWAYDKQDPSKIWSVLVFEVGSRPVLVEEF